MSTAAPSVSRTVSRDDIVRLGQSGRPWDFLPIAAMALRQVPDDLGLRLITASNFVRLGLKSAAAEHLSLLPEQILASPEVQGLVRVVRDLPADIVNPDERIAMCRGNLEALGSRGPGTGQEFERWASGVGSSVYCRACDGNVIARTVAGGEWRVLSDQRAALSRMVREHFSPTSPELTRPVYIEGIDPPWLLIHLTEARTREPTGYLAPITIVQAEFDQFFDGLSMADLRAILSAGNITALVGPHASRDLAAHLESRSIYQTSGPGLTTLATRTRVSPPLAEAIASANRRQEALLTELTRRAVEAYPPRDAASWRARFDEALSGGAPLRVLIPTTRYSTFIQHASRDLARALENRGHTARVLIEPDDSTKFVTYAYLAACLEWRPDLIITINYPRAALDGAVPAHVPYVCWVQDAMPHLFSPALGAAQGPLDFLVGHLFDELFDRHNYPREHALSAAIVADETKFHIGPVAAPQRARFECEIAYVSHQSEPPDIQHNRLNAEFAKLGIGNTLERLRPIIEREAFKALTDLRTTDTREYAIDALRRELGREPDARTVDVVTRSYCQPHMDRLIRHQTLDWAAEVADRRGWRLKLFGKGWESHPRLSRFAAGPLDHGDDLRCSYACAAVHLHMMAHALVHQRLIECVLSGGFPLCRLHAPERWAIVECLSRLGVRQGAQPIEGLDHPDILKPCRVPSWADAPALMQLASAMQRLGLFEASFRTIGGACPGPMINEQEWLRPQALREHEMDLWSAFGLLGQSEQFMFHSRETLEQRVESAINRPDLREASSAAARRRFLDRFTYPGLACRLLDFVRDHLSPAGSAAGTPPRSPR